MLQITYRFQPIKWRTSVEEQESGYDDDHYKLSDTTYYTARNSSVWVSWLQLLIETQTDKDDINVRLLSSPRA